MSSPHDDSARIDVPLTPAEREALNRVARHLKVSPEDLARLTLEDVLTQSTDDLRRTVEYLLMKKRDQERQKPSSG